MKISRELQLGSSSNKDEINEQRRLCHKSFCQVKNIRTKKSYQLCPRFTKNIKTRDRMGSCIIVIKFLKNLKNTVFQSAAIVCSFSKDFFFFFFLKQEQTFFSLHSSPSSRLQPYPHFQRKIVVWFHNKNGLFYYRSSIFSNISLHQSTCACFCFSANKYENCQTRKLFYTDFYQVGF